jgi:hypothetical protein
MDKTLLLLLVISGLLLRRVGPPCNLDAHRRDRASCPHDTDDLGIRSII